MIERNNFLHYLRLFSFDKWPLLLKTFLEVLLNPNIYWFHYQVLVPRNPEAPLPPSPLCRDCSQIMSAKNGVVQTPHHPLVSHCQHFPNPTFPLSQPLSAFPQALPPFVIPVSICLTPSFWLAIFLKYIQGYCVQGSSNLVERKHNL